MKYHKGSFPQDAAGLHDKILPNLREPLKSSYKEAMDNYRSGFVADYVQSLHAPVERLQGLLAEQEIHDKLKFFPHREFGTIRNNTEEDSHVTNAMLEKDIDDISKALQDRGLILEKPQSSSLHHFFDWIGMSPRWKSWFKFLQEDAKSSSKSPLDLYQSFVVEHDWAKLLEGKIDDGDFPLPYEGTCFEFRITGMRVLFLVSCQAGSFMSSDVQCKMVVGINGRWHVNADRFYFSNGKLFSYQLKKAIEDGAGGWAEKFLLMIGRQIKATCVMLDAEVVTRETIRVSEKLNRQRVQKGKPPMQDYHVVNLSRKYRASPIGDHEKSNRQSPRLHMRRGHWRHYQDHRTWINWMMVGDESLGFVDKEYRL